MKDKYIVIVWVLEIVIYFENINSFSIIFCFFLQIKEEPMEPRSSEEERLKRKMRTPPPLHPGIPPKKQSPYDLPPASGSNPSSSTPSLPSASASRTPPSRSRPGSGTEEPRGAAGRPVPCRPKVEPVERKPDGENDNFTVIYLWRKSFFSP